MTDYRFNRRIAAGVRTLTEEEFKELHPKYQPGMRVVIFTKGEKGVFGATPITIGLTNMPAPQPIRRNRVTRL